MTVRNPSLLKRPWLFPIYTVIGGVLGLVFGGPKVISTAVIIVALVIIALLNAWFFVSLKQTTRDQKSPGS
jgi:hypothetical protein